MKNCFSFIITLLLFLFISNTNAQQKSITDQLINFGDLDYDMRMDHILENFKQFASDRKLNKKILLKNNSEVLEVVDSLKYYTEDSVYHRDALSYDSDGFLSEEIVTNWNGSAWNNSTKSNYTFNEEGLLSLKVIERWNEDKWVNQRRTVYEYSEDYLAATETIEIWDSTQWIFNSKYGEETDAYGNILSLSREEASGFKIEYLYEYKEGVLVTKEEVKFSYLGTIVAHEIRYNTYDEENFLVKAEFERLVEEEYKSLFRAFYTYNINGLEETMLEETVDTLGNWMLNYREDYYYDDNSLIDSTIAKDWNSIDSIWVLSSKEEQDFDEAGNMTYYGDYYWDADNNNWEPSSRRNIQYNINGEVVLELRQRYENSEWVNYLRSAIEFNNDGNLVSAYYQRWYDNNWEYDDNYFTVKQLKNINLTIDCAYIEEVFYNQLTDITNNFTTITEYTLEQNYPNPFNPTTIISYTIGTGQQSAVQLKVFDMLGREVAVLVNKKMSAGTYRINFDASNLSSGVYFYQLKANNFTRTKKMMLLR